MAHYIPPASPTNTVFDPEDDTFGPIMAAIQEGDFEVARDKLDALTAKARPAFPESGVCPACGSEDWYDVEEGYTRMSSATVEDGEFRVFQDGWDDMSEGGNEQYVACAACGAHYDYPTIPVEYEG